MADTLPSAIVNDLVDRLRTALDPIGVMAGPPENAPQGLMCWVRYGPTDFEWMMFEIRRPLLRVTVVVPSGSNYADAYNLINDTAHLVAAALRVPKPTEGSTVMLAGECPITAVRIEEPVRGTWFGTDAAIMATDVSISIETKDINQGA